MNGKDQTPVKDSVMTVLFRGFMRKCPRCGNGRLFRGYLKPVDTCRNCGEHLGHIRADDIPAYFTIIVVGHIVVPLAALVERQYHPEVGVHMSIWIPVLLMLTFTLLPRIKGSLVGLMWHLGLRGDEMQ